MEIIAKIDKPYSTKSRIDFVEEYQNKKKLLVKETETALEAWGYTDEEIAQIREDEFKSDFFEVPDSGWYRRKPKGYSSAVESLNTAFNAVSIMGHLPEGMLIFYQEPDFTDPEQCTEEWLIEHQIKSPAMTAQEFGQLYVNFMTAWNTSEHERLTRERERERQANV